MTVGTVLCRECSEPTGCAWDLCSSCIVSRRALELEPVELAQSDARAAGFTFSALKVLSPAPERATCAECIAPPYPPAPPLYCEHGLYWRVS